ncbi:hypothetical protein GF389_05665 [Candidatus Dojkabacteria bacterium]|nr:hypothetical protein [Candidatus Dojkabacteria bacterium]
MLIKKLRYSLNRLFFRVSRLVFRWGLNLNYLLFIVITFLVIAFLSFNIYKTVQRAEANYKIKEEERVKRDELLSESEFLEEEIAYLESHDATRNMAVSGYRMAEPGEDLYVIERNDIVYDYIEEENPDPIDFEDNRFWWRVIIGI